MEMNMFYIILGATQSADPQITQDMVEVSANMIKAYVHLLYEFMKNPNEDTRRLARSELDVITTMIRGRLEESQ